MFRWLKKKVRKNRHCKVKKMPDVRTPDYSLHIYEEITNNDVFAPHHVRTSSLPSASRKGYPLFKPEHLARDALYSVAKIPGIDSPRLPSTSISRRKLSFEETGDKKGNSQSWSAAHGVFSDDSDTGIDDDDGFEFDLGSSSDVFVQAKNASSSLTLCRTRSITRSDTGRDYRSDTGRDYRSVTGRDYRSVTGRDYRSETGRDYRSSDTGRDYQKGKLERDSSLRSSASKNSEASSGFFSEDPDSDSLRMSSIRRKYRIQTTNRSQCHSTFVRHPSVNSRPKHHKVNDCVTPSYHNPSRSASGHFRRQKLPVPVEPLCSPVYLSPIKIVMQGDTDSMAPPRSTVPRKINKRRSEGQSRDYTPLRSCKHSYGVKDVFSAYEIPDFCGKTSNLPVEVPKQRRAHRNIDGQPVFWKRENNQLLQDVIRSNYERQMCIFV